MSSSTDEILRRLRRVEDREEIRALVGRYTVAMDDHDMETTAKLFMPNASVRSKDGVMVSQGLESILEMYRGRFRALGATFHYTHDQFVEWDPTNEDRARGLVVGHAEVWRNGEQYLAALRYEDVYVRHEGRWKFQDRVLGFMYYVSTTEYPKILAEKNRIKVYGDAKPANWPETAPTYNTWERAA